MHEFLNALNEFRDTDQKPWSDQHDDRQLGTVMEVVISATRSKIGSAFADGKKIPAKLKAEVAA